MGRSSTVRRSLAWSVAVVLSGGVLAALTTSPAPGQSIRQQGVGPAVAAEQAGAAPAAAGPTPSGSVGAAPTTAGAPSPAKAGASGAAARAGTPAAPTTRARATAAASPTAATPAAAAATKLQPDAGSYPLQITGSSSVDNKPSTVPSSGSLVISSSGGDQEQRTVGVPGDLVVVQRASSAGIDVVSFSLTAGSKALTFRPGSPVPFLRTSPGASWSWSVRSTDGTVGLSQTATVSGAGSVSVNGVSVPAVTVSRVFTVSGAASGTVRLTSTVSQLDRLPLVQHQAINVTATVLGLLSTHVVSDATATLTSTRPS
jgi:hypothetical protein